MKEINHSPSFSSESVWDPKGTGYASFVEQYVFWNKALAESGYQEILHNEIKGFLPRRVSLALDLCCGPGHHTLWLADQVDHVVGIDISRTMIGLAKRQQSEKGTKNVDFMIADASCMPFMEGVLDFVISINALQRLSLKEVFSRLPRLIAPGGRMVITDLVTPRPRLDAYPLWQAFGVLRKAPKYVKDCGLRTMLRMLSFEMGAKWIRYNSENVRYGYRMTQETFEATYKRLLPGCRFRRYGWRCAVFWESSHHN